MAVYFMVQRVKVIIDRKNSNITLKKMCFEKPNFSFLGKKKKL